MNLNLESNTPKEIFGLKDERVEEIMNKFNENIKSEMEVKTLVKAASELAQTDEELGFLIMGIGRIIGMAELAEQL